MRVPNVIGRNVTQAYARLHRAGLRVSTSKPLSLTSLGFPQARAQSPRAGRTVEHGTSVVLTLYQPPTVAPHGPSRTIRVPRLTAARLSVAVGRLERAGLTYWVVDKLPRLRASGGRSFFAAYRGVAQHPAVGRLFREQREVGDATPVTLSVRLLK